MSGQHCPVCGARMEFLRTDNEWMYACLTCDRRYNDDGVAMPPVDQLAIRPLRPGAVERETVILPPREPKA